jgi:hypothetical protein
VSKFEDIRDGSDPANWTKTSGILYTCNAGWIDLGHLNPRSSRPEIGAANLWRQVSKQGQPAVDPSCERLVSGFEDLPRPFYCFDQFPDGQRGHLVRYRQDQTRARVGIENYYIVRPGLTVAEQRSVALAIFQEVSLQFEAMQLAVEWTRVTNSGFSREDLISNLIGFYIGVGVTTQADAVRLCHPVSKKAAQAIWQRDGALGVRQNKNRNWQPKLADTAVLLDKAVTDECAMEPRVFPKLFTTIRPATNGNWFRKLGY